MGQAKFQVSFELLRQLLHMPGDTRIRDILCENMDIYHERFTVYVEHWELPEVEPPVLISPITREIRWDWNLDESI